MGLDTGGWILACDLALVTLRDIYAALGSPTLLAVGNRTETPGCAVEQAVNAALRKSFDEAEALPARAPRCGYPRKPQLTPHDGSECSGAHCHHTPTGHALNKSKRTP